MRKQYLLTILLLCSLLGTIYSKSGVPYKTYFPDCELTVTASSTEKDTICLGSSVGLVATAGSGTSPYTYSWLPTAGLSNSHIYNPVATPTVSTNYTVTVTDHSGCTATASVNIIVNQPPVVIADSLLEQYLTNRPLTAVGGTPPYTYNFSPAISTSGLVTMLTSTVTTIYTITVTGANGCANVYHTTYTPLQGITAGACRTPFISEYIQDTIHNDDGIEIYNPTSGSINLNTYYLAGTTNGSLYATPFFIALHGTIAAHSTFLIANTYADTSLTHKAGMLSDSLSFGGKDIVTLLNINISVSGVQTTALDMVGAISPLPTDSGWAVGAGSTKNHTLTRQTSVVQGDMNWTTCKTEWNVYPRGTFTYIGHYENVCGPKDPYLYLTLANDSVSCGDPSYFYFDVLIQSDFPERLNNVEFNISYPLTEFAGDNIYTGIYVKRGPGFEDDSPLNDYGTLFTQAHPNVLNIQIGQTVDESPEGVVIDSIPKVLFTIRLQITNSCQSGTISFYDTTATRYEADWANEDSTFNYVDSTRSSFDTCCPYVCGDTTGPYYDYNYHCCDTSCLTVCYDSTNLWPVYCYETIWHYTIDSVYAYTYIANVAFTDTYYTDSLATSGCSMRMDAPSSVNAGTNNKSAPVNSSILHITGAGFGIEKDSILVSNANAPGMCRLDTTDILSWAENEIVLRMPNFIINNTTATPGTGPMKLYNVCGDSASSNLQVNYNIENAYYSPQMARPNIIMSTHSNSIVFRYDTSVSNNPQALACIKKAIRTWNCYTGVNWKLGTDTILDTSLADGISDIYFSNNFVLASPILMVTQPQLSPCYSSSDSVAFYDEADIKMRITPPSGKPWNYDTTYTVLIGSYYYFYDVILHELGHAIGLAHINDPFSLMYYTTISGRRDSIPGLSMYPGPGTLLGALDMVNTSIAFTPASFYCPDNILITDTRGCIDHTLNLTDIPQNSYSLNLYPNPINYGNLTITYDLTQNSQIQFKITDCAGRMLVMLPQEHKPAGDYSEQINVSNLAQGVYLFVANINGEYQTIKFIKI